MVRTIYQQPSPEEVHAQHARMVGMLDERFPRAAGLPTSEAAPTGTTRLRDWWHRRNLTRQSPPDLKELPEAIVQLILLPEFTLPDD